MTPTQTSGPTFEQSILLRRAPRHPHDAGDDRAFSVTVLIAELNDPSQAAKPDDQQLYVVEGVWKAGSWESLSVPADLWQGEPASHLLRPPLEQLEDQRGRVAHVRKFRRRLIHALAPLIFLWCIASAWGVGAWVTREHVVEQAVDQNRIEMQRQAEARLAAAAASAAQRQAGITEALRRERELRAVTEQQAQAVEAQRQLDNLAREALGLILVGELEPGTRKLEQALSALRDRNDLRAGALLRLSAARALIQKDSHSEAEAYLKNLLDELSAMPEPDPTLLIDVHTHLASVCRAQQRGPEALEHLRAVFKLREKSWGSGDPRLIPILQEAAAISSDLSKFDAVESICRRILAMRAANDSNGSDEIDDLSLMALAQVRQGKFEDANQVCARILSIETPLSDDQEQQLSRTLRQLAHLYVEKGQYAQGMLLLERSLRDAADPLRSRDADDLRLLARLYVREQRYQQAEPIYLRLVESREKSAGGNDPILADDASELAELYERQNRFSEAEALYQLAMTIREEVLGPYHLDVAKSAMHLADLYRVQNKSAQADALYDLAREIRSKSREMQR